MRAACGARSGRRCSGDCGKRDQQGGLGQRQALRLLAEISEARGAHALQIAAIGRQREIEREDLFLGEPRLQLDGAAHLAQFGSEAAFFARLQQPRHLHGERRGAGDDAAMGDELEGGAHHGERIDAAMLVEALVLIADQHLE